MILASIDGAKGPGSVVNRIAPPPSYPPSFRTLRDGTSPKTSLLYPATQTVASAFRPVSVSRNNRQQLHPTGWCGEFQIDRFQYGLHCSFDRTNWPTQTHFDCESQCASMMLGKFQFSARLRILIPATLPFMLEIPTVAKDRPAPPREVPS